MPTTTNILLNIPTHGTFVDTWDVPNNGDWTSADGFLGGVQAISVAGSSPVTLTAPTGTPTPAGGPTQAENRALKFVGALTGNVTVTLPLPGSMIVHNLTTGNFVLIFRAVGVGQVIAIEQGQAQRIYNDGTNVYFTDLPAVGSYLDVCDSAVPAWITACTVPPYLNCNAGTFSAVTYPYLAIKLGGTTLPDSRGGVRAALNQGTSRLQTANGVNGDLAQARGGADSIQLGLTQLPTGITVTGTVTVNPAGSASNFVPYLVGASWGQFAPNGVTGATNVPLIGSGSVLQTSSFSGTNTLTSNNTNGQSHSNVQPTFIGGLTLIRAA